VGICYPLAHPNSKQWEKRPAPWPTWLHRLGNMGAGFCYRGHCRPAEVEF